MTLLNIAQMRRYVELWKECEQLEATLKERTAELANLGRVVSDEMVSNGVLGFPLEAVGKAFHLYLHTGFSVRRNKGVEREAALAALSASGAEWMIRKDYSAATLSAWVKEQLGEHRELPDAFDAAFHVHTEEEQRVRGATSKKSLSAKAASFYRQQAMRNPKPRNP